LACQFFAGQAPGEIVRHLERVHPVRSVLGWQ